MRPLFFCGNGANAKGTMKRIALVAVTLFLSAVTSSLAETNAAPAYEPWDWTKYQDKFGGHGNEMAPQRGDLFGSVGPALVVGKVEVPSDIGGKSREVTRYGGFVTGEYFVTRAVSLQGTFGAYDDAVEVSAGAFQGTATAFDVGLAAKLYPLQISRPSEFRFQPHLVIGIDGVFFDVTATFNGADVSSSVSIDPVAIVRAGGGVDILLDSQWAVTLDAAYFHSIADTDAKISGVGSVGVGFSGVFASAGLRCRF